MRYLLTFLFCILLTSSAYAGEIDGKGIICKYKFKGKVKSYNALFNSGRVSIFWVLTWETQWLKRNTTSKDDPMYHVDIDYIKWGVHGDVYTINRKTLDIEYKTDRPLPEGSATQWSGKCRVTDREGLEKELDKKIEEIKASLKKNKL